jgi:hypothetical protein
VRPTRDSLDPVRVQAAYYLATGLWPIVHLRSFVALTGPKSDTWLVQTFGALIAAVGGVLLSDEDASGRAVQARLAITSGLTLAAADAWFVARRRIRPIYLADAAVELAFAAATWRRRRL